MSSETILRPDAKGRVGLASLTRLLRERFTGQPISGFAAEITPDGAILLRPQIEVDATEAATLILNDADRDAFLDTLAAPPPPNERMRAAAKRHRRQVIDQ
jgi:hypothetical protein